MFFFDIRILITPLVFSNSSYKYFNNFNFTSRLCLIELCVLFLHYVYFGLHFFGSVANKYSLCCQFMEDIRSMAVQVTKLLYDATHGVVGYIFELILYFQVVC
jgi:hypothetical protein